MKRDIGGIAFHSQGLRRIWEAGMTIYFSQLENWNVRKNLSSGKKAAEWKVKYIRAFNQYRHNFVTI